MLPTKTEYSNPFHPFPSRAPGPPSILDRGLSVSSSESSFAAERFKKLLSSLTGVDSPRAARQIGMLTVAG